MAAWVVGRGPVQGSPGSTRPLHPCLRHPPFANKHKPLPLHGTTASPSPTSPPCPRPCSSLGRPTTSEPCCVQRRANLKTPARPRGTQACPLHAGTTSGALLTECLAQHHAPANLHDSRPPIQTLAASFRRDYLDRLVRPHSWSLALLFSDTFICQPSLEPLLVRPHPPRSSQHARKNARLLGSARQSLGPQSATAPALPLGCPRLVIE